MTMRQTKRSVWHERTLTGKRGRPKSCPQWLWYWATPDRQSPLYGGSMRLTGWFGGRHRDKPEKLIWWHCVHGVWMGTISARASDTVWSASVRERAGRLAVERSFGRRRDAKRWVEAEAARRGAAR